MNQPQPAGVHYRNDPAPRQVAVDDAVGPGEAWESWAFEAPRGKGGPVAGEFTLVTAATGARRGWVDFKGRSRRPA